MAILRRSSFAFPRQWNPTQVPNFPVEVDWTHVLSRSLVSLYIPGAPSGLSDLVANGPVLTPESAVTLAASPQGPGLLNTAVNQGVYGLLPAILKVSTDQTYTWSGKIFGPPSNNSLITGAVYDNVVNSPYTARALFLSSSNQIYLEQGYPNDLIGTITAPLGSMVSFAGTFPSSGTGNTIYQNGSVLANGNAGGSPSYTATSSWSVGDELGTSRYSNVLTTSFSAYNRVLSAGDAAWLAAEPFIMVRPIIRRQFFVPVVGGVTVSLTQQAGTGSVGSLTPSTSTALTQDAGTGAVGVVAPAAALPLAQVSGTGTVGSVSLGTSAALAQTAGTGTVGAVAPAISAPLAGVAATGDIGSVAAVTAIGLSQVVGTGAIGAVAPGVSIPLAEVAGVGTVGTITASIGSNVTATLGQTAATGDVGTITANISGPVTVALAQVVATGAVGALAPSASVGIAQTAATGTVGSLAWGAALGLAQVVGLGAAGTIAATTTGDVTAALTGTAAPGIVGVVVASGNAPVVQTGGSEDWRWDTAPEGRRRLLDTRNRRSHTELLDDLRRDIGIVRDEPEPEPPVSPPVAAPIITAPEPAFTPTAPAFDADAYASARAAAIRAEIDKADALEATTAAAARAAWIARDEADILVLLAALV